jgi:hypothetical protein
MKKQKDMKKIILTIGIIVGVFIVTQAQERPTVPERQKNQLARTAHGINNGDLTVRETKRIARQQRHINRDKKRAMADGVVTAGERRHIKSQQRRTSRNIYRQKHDAQSRF